MLKKLATLAIVTGLIGVGAIPASAQSDTTPPQLVSLSLSPSTVDTASSAASVVVTAVITDDLSGVSTTNTELCADIRCLNGLDWFHYAQGVTSGDTYIATITYPQYSGGTGGIFRDWLIYLADNAGNHSWIDGQDLLARGINLAVGVNAFSPSYARTVTLKLSKTKASGSVGSANDSACWFWVPVVLQLKTKAGWKVVEKTYANYNGDFRVPIHGKGTYRVTAAKFALGTPAVTTCQKASKKAVLK